jgi:cation diffusion facilitator CzcD-associated flavoprotein CzcO
MRGIDGITLSEAWSEGVKTYLGLFVKAFPNMAMIMGPHQAFGNIPRSIEFAVESVTRFIQYCLDNGITFAEASKKGVDEWTVSRSEICSSIYVC